MIILLLSSNTPNDENDGNNVNPNIPSNRPQQSRNEFDIVQSSPNHGTNLLEEGIVAGQRIAKISVITLIAIVIVELITGFVSGSVVATADGIDSISDAMISFIVLLGLRLAHRPPDKKFHFGYQG